MSVTREERDAARQYLEHDHASETLRGEPARIANEQANEIDEKHDRARDIALTGTAQELGDLPAHLRKHQIAARQRAGINSERAAEIRAEYRAGDARRGRRVRAGNPRPNRAPAARRSRANGVLERAAAPLQSAGAQLIAPTTNVVSSGGGLVLKYLGWGLGLSLLYLVITRGAEGPAGQSGIERLVGGISTGVTGLVSAHSDPLAMKAAPVAASTGAMRIQNAHGAPKRRASNSRTTTKGTHR